MNEINDLAPSGRATKMDKYFMSVAQLTALLSTCAAVKVGAVLTKNNRILSTGYNGVASGQKHCEDIFGGLDLHVGTPDRVRHHEFTQKHEIHAEVNAILDAGKRDTLETDTTMYVSTRPCFDCIKVCIASGVKRIVYLHEYDLQKDDPADEILKLHGIVFEKYEDLLK
jgi:dCMP deaminase